MKLHRLKKKDEGTTGILQWAGMKVRKEFWFLGYCDQFKGWTSKKEAQQNQDWESFLIKEKDRGGCKK